MEAADVIVVGGGPAGSACAGRLVRAGRSVIVLDRVEFPRTKLCAGWITPEVVADLNFDVEAYPHRFNTFNGIVVHLKWLRFTLPSVQHSIRRFEFDDYLLKRSGARLYAHNVRSIERDPDGFIVDGAFRSRYLVGAGGTRCPVYRTLFRAANPRARELQAATYEHEFPYQWQDERCHLWFFEKGLPGYAWYVPKADGYLNCGIGGMAEKLKSRGEDIKRHWNYFIGSSRGADSFEAPSLRRRVTATICAAVSTWCGWETRSSPATRPGSRPVISAKESAPRSSAAIVPQSRSSRARSTVSTT